jgi:hypothetical protein
MIDRNNPGNSLVEFVTPVWRALAQSLPPAVQKRYLQDLKSAEDFDIALDRVIAALFSRSGGLRPAPRRPAESSPQGTARPKGTRRSSRR